MWEKISKVVRNTPSYEMWWYWLWYNISRVFDESGYEVTLFVRSDANWNYQSWQYLFSTWVGIDPHKHHVLVPKSLSALPSYNYFEFASQLQLPTNTTQSLEHLLLQTATTSTHAKHCLDTFIYIVREQCFNKFPIKSAHIQYSINLYVNLFTCRRIRKTFAYIYIQKSQHRDGNVKLNVITRLK